MVPATPAPSAVATSVLSEAGAVHPPGSRHACDPITARHQQGVQAPAWAHGPPSTSPSALEGIPTLKPFGAPGLPSHLTYHGCPRRTSVPSALLKAAGELSG